MATQNNNVLAFTPLTSDQKSTTLVSVKWSQSFKERSEQYYAIAAKNKNTNVDVALFIQKSLYDLNEEGTADGSGKTSGPKPVSAIARIQDGKVELTINNTFQYGQQNAAGEKRFVVYHDTEHKPYQHRFIETSLGSLAGKSILAVAKVLGYDNLGTPIGDFSKKFIGDYMRTF